MDNHPLSACATQDLTWDEAVLDTLAAKVEYEPDGDYAIEGAKEANVVLSRHVSRALRVFRQGARDPEHNGSAASLQSVKLAVTDEGQVVASADEGH